MNFPPSSFQVRSAHPDLAAVRPAGPDAPEEDVRRVHLAVAPAARRREGGEALQHPTTLHKGSTHMLLL